MAFEFKKHPVTVDEPRVVMAVEMNDGDKVQYFKYIVPRLKRSQIIAAQRDARRSLQDVKVAKGQQAQAIASAELVSILLDGVSPLEGAPEIDVLFDYLGDENVEPFMEELFRLATEDYATLRAEGVEVL